MSNVLAPLCIPITTHTHTRGPATTGWQTDTHASKPGKLSQTTNKHALNGPSQGDPALAEFNGALAISVGNVGDTSKCKTYIFPPNSKLWSFQGPNVPGSGQMDTLGFKNTIVRGKSHGKKPVDPRVSVT